MSKHVEILSEQLKGELVVSIDQEVWDEAAEEWKWALVLRPLVTKRPNIHVIASILKKAWKTTSEVTFSEVPNERIVAKFSDEKSRRWVEEGGPWTLGGMAIPITRWSSEQNPEHMEMNKIQIWVQIHKIPAHLMSKEDVIRDLAGVVGRVCGSHKQDTTDVSRNRYTRYKVEINVNNPLRSGCFLNKPGGDPIWLVFKYERLPDFCRRCGVLSHETKGCSAESNGSRFGRWLRADCEEFGGPNGGEDRQCRESTKVAEPEERPSGQGKELAVSGGETSTVRIGGRKGQQEESQRKSHADLGGRAYLKPKGATGDVTGYTRKMTSDLTLEEAGGGTPDIEVRDNRDKSKTEQRHAESNKKGCSSGNFQKKGDTEMVKVAHIDKGKESLTEKVTTKGGKGGKGKDVFIRPKPIAGIPQAVVFQGVSKEVLGPGPTRKRRQGGDVGNQPKGESDRSSIGNAGDAVRGDKEIRVGNSECEKCDDGEVGDEATIGELLSAMIAKRSRREP